MAVIVEGISVIIRASSILEKYPGGWMSFKEHLPNKTLCADSELIRIGFMSSGDVKAFINSLNQHDIIYLQEGIPIDLTVIDQLKGPMVYCDWVEFGAIDWDGDPKKKIAACRLAGSCINQVLTPDGWDYDGSLSNQYGFAPSNETNEKLVFVRKEDGCDVYLDISTGK